MIKDSFQDVLLQQKSGLVQVTLNRPQALNALTHNMVRYLTVLLKEWEGSDAVQAVLFLGAGDRAFCAGGDIKAAYQAGMAFKTGSLTLSEVAGFFGDEYRLNRFLFQSDLVMIALMNGIVMGGGFGIAGPCKYRIASESTVFAMPETGIGFFPDIGGAYYLAQTPGYIGAYLAVSGDRITAEDTFYAGIATHYIPHNKQDGVIESLCDNKMSRRDVRHILDSHSEMPDMPSVLQDKQDLIDRCFAHDSVEAILDALAAEDDDWAQEKRALILSRAPLSTKIALAHYRRARSEDFNIVIERDFRLAQHFLNDYDFYEGVRCALIDKGAVPQWKPPSLAAVTNEKVASYFVSAGQGLDEEVLA